MQWVLTWLGLKVLTFASLAVMKRLSIAYITVEDPRTKRSWSGTNYYLMRAIERHVGDVDVLGPLSAEPQWTLCRILNFISLKLLGKRYNFRDSYIISRAYARRIKKLLSQRQYDLIIAPAGTATMAALKTDVPIVYINDRSVHTALDYHKILTNLYGWSRRESVKVEQKVIEKSLLSVYSSAWAADGARSVFADRAHKIHVLPFGANLDEDPIYLSDKPFPPPKLRLLFAGVNWKEKGGDIAFDALKHLLDKGILTQLIICGCVPPEEVSNHPAVLVEGFLSKDDVRQFAKLQSHFRKADFLILPTRFEAYGLVFCEAAANGLPVLASRTGGIPTIVDEGITGYLFDMQATGWDYANKIEALLNQPELYRSMRTAGRKKYFEQLNWDAFGMQLNALVRDALAKK